MNFPYWHKQTAQQPLFPEIAWQRPEQKSLAGKLLIIGGNKLGFAAVAQGYNDALKAGAGECRALLPEALKKVIDSHVLDCVFTPTNPSGGMSKDALPILKASAAWADALLLIGDNGRNSETAIVLEQLLTETDKLAIVTRDSVDLLRASLPTILKRQQTVLIATLAQLQKIFQAVYYPKTILFSMQLSNLVETLHKFTITYPVTIVVFHQNHLVVALAGTVSSTPWEEPMMIWRGSVAAKAAVYAMQQPKRLLEAITVSLL
jgi:NAD(P)H-hydrate repair Nnr-like enzyme with NAD(P)H-hydrate dehydratase domain